MVSSFPKLYFDKRDTNDEEDEEEEDEKGDEENISLVISHVPQMTSRYYCAIVCCP
jgi:hypothetical protein